MQVQYYNTKGSLTTITCLKITFVHQNTEVWTNNGYLCLIKDFVCAESIS